MFLKSLEIRGFKSFADKTNLKFKTGVTAVVGPNGSGKSNISDSVRWVLGEQSIKTLRGGKMEDVIFAGTQFRKPVGLAQVSLTLDNSDGALGTDYSEVTVTRRIFRSGETEYLINNRKCRLKDITNLFMDTGIGKEGYSLIGQGKIDAILSGKADERRALLEEAAGIVKFKTRKEEAEKKLANTEANLVRIRDIISTYEERIEPLKIEKEKALKYKILAEELKVKEVSIIVHQINNLESELSNLKEILNTKYSDLEKKKKVLSKLKAILIQLQNEIEEVEKKNFKEREEYYSKKEKATQYLSDIEIFKERISNIEFNIDKNHKELDILKEEIKRELDEKNNLEEELLSKRKEQKEREEILINYEKEVAKLSKEFSTLENELKNLKDDEFELLSKNSEIKNSIILLEKEITTKEESKLSLISQVKGIEVNISINSATAKGIRESKGKAVSEIITLKNDISSKKQELTSLNMRLRDIEKNIRIVNNKISSLEGRYTVLTDLEKSYEGYNKSVQRLMERISKDQIADASDTKVLGEVFTVPSGFETAIEIALGATISNVITRDDNVAKRLIQFLKKNNVGRATFLPLNIIKGNTLSISKEFELIDGYLGLASEIVIYDNKFKNIIEYCLGRTVIAKDMDIALEISRKSNHKVRIVTLEGEVIAPGGALTGGSIYSKGTNILSRKAEIETISKEIEILKESLKLKVNEIESLRSNIKMIDDNILDITDEVNNRSHDVTRFESEIKNIENDEIRLNNSLRVSNRELEIIESNFDKLTLEIESRKEKLEDLEGIKLNNKDRVTEIEGLLKNHKIILEDLKEKSVEVKVKKAALDEIVISKITEVRRKDKLLEDKNNKILESNNLIKAWFNNIESLNIDINNREAWISGIEKRIYELDQIFKEDEILKIEIKDKVKINETETIDIQNSISTLETELNKVQIQNAKFESEKESHYKKLNEELELTLVEAKDIAEEIVNLQSIKEKIYNLKSRITALGTVNLASIAEYEEVSEKYEFMANQELDLNNAKAELLEVIKEMTIKMQVLFRENFVILNENFGETFKDLFKGGSAELILSEGDELTSNIEINVQPPGKKLQNINLMSGGEKVLSAIALLFAILKMKPTPFCILDEIEAALDDANVYRYAEFLKKFSKNSQFIVITHRKGTMEASDVMYGVTMEEKGISKVVSVDLSKVE